MNSTRRLIVDIQDYWITGTGRGGIHDAATRTDRDGLPFLPGRHLRGLLRDAMETLAAFRDDVLDAEVKALFGTDDADTENQPGLIEVRDALLPPPVVDAILHAPRRRDALFEVLRVTMMDAEHGTAKDRTLRNLRVAVPMTLEGEIAWRVDAPANHPMATRWDGLMEEALPLVMAVGANRHRGLGRAWLRLAP